MYSFIYMIYIYIYVVNLAQILDPKGHHVDHLAGFAAAATERASEDFGVELCPEAPISLGYSLNQIGELTT